MINLGAGDVYLLLSLNKKSICLDRVVMSRFKYYIKKQITKQKGFIQATCKKKKNPTYLTYVVFSFSLLQVLTFHFFNHFLFTT